MKTPVIPHPLPLPRGLIARVAIQCTCPDTGETGSFLFAGESHRASCSRVSPVYDDLAELFPAVRAEWDEVTPGNCANGYTFKGNVHPLTKAQWQDAFDLASKGSANWTPSEAKRAQFYRDVYGV